MIFGAFVLALHTSADRPPGVSEEKYLVGFFFTLGGATLLGLCWPLVELAYSMGVMCTINCTSSLFAGILTSSVLLPFTELAAIVVFHEKFTVEKGLSLALCLWGFTSYFIREYQKTDKTYTHDGIEDRTDIE
ncbi:hypothetical protein FRX31_030335 [Thalictrum thalictroides]|uniref:Uncharacterized protein n=1 Tax=Thalictrum thalictroides TaxID=46969 RepID=A0A7J6V795_THATH|nr:hypothetical protein FRX31_030335 [Thalictrum thalictroides]